MNTTSLEDVLSPLRASRQRLMTQVFLTLLVKLLLLAGVILVLLAAVNRWLLGSKPWDWTLAGWAACGAAGLALLITLARRKSLPEMAVLVDRLGHTHDRFVTALTFAKRTEPSPMGALAFGECARFVREGKFGGLIPVRFPREVAWLLAPALTIAFLQWDGAEHLKARLADETAARAAVEKTAKKLEELARETEKANEENKSEQLRKLAEQLQRSADQLRAKPGDPSEADKSALRELSALEQMIQEMQKSPEAVSPEEMKALADALKDQEATKDAASALAAGDMAKAAEELDKAMEKAAEQKDERTPEEIQKALQQALQKLAEQKQLSEAMKKLAQQMQRASQPGGNSSEAAKQLAQMLRQMAQGKSGQQQSSGQQQTAQTMEKMMSALQSMKFGDGEPQPSSSPQSGPSGKVAMQSFGQSDPSAPSSQGDPEHPSGHPGSEHDVGTTDNPFGKEQNPAGKEAQEKQIAGRQGEGESLQQSLLSAGDSSKSKRGYRQLYEAMAPAAQDAVVQENIPLGSRFFIKRYFESIRPQE